MGFCMVTAALDNAFFFPQWIAILFRLRLMSANLHLGKDPKDNPKRGIETQVYTVRRTTRDWQNFATRHLKSTAHRLPSVYHLVRNNTCAMPFERITSPTVKLKQKTVAAPHTGRKRPNVAAHSYSISQMQTNIQSKTKVGTKNYSSSIANILAMEASSAISRAVSVAALIKEKETKEESSSVRVYHGPQCRSCADLQSISEENMAHLQHHFKFCTTYSIYYRVMKNLEITVVSKKISNQTNQHVLHHNQAKSLCRATREKSNDIFSIGDRQQLNRSTPALIDVDSLFETAANMSDELIGPAESGAFNCDRYEEYLRCLQSIAKLIKADQKLLDDIENYLKPYCPQKKEEMPPVGTTRSQTSKVKEWDETFVDLKHSTDDQHFGSEWKQIAESDNNLIFPKMYTFGCHEQKTTKNKKVFV